MKLTLKASLIGIFTLLLTYGCTKDPEAPKPPEVEYPEVTKTIQDLRNLVTGSEAYEVPANFVFKGIVVSNQGESNNFYRALYLQSGEVSIKVSCDKNALYETLEKGQEVYVKADGLFVCKYYDTYTLGYQASGDKYKVSLISADKQDIVLVPGEKGKDITPKEINDLSTLSPDMVGTLVKVNNVQVVEGDRNKKLGGDGSSGYTSLTFTKADGETIQISNNNYASFGDQTVPDGSGSITGILNTFSTDFQIANTRFEDLDLSGERFEVDNGSGGDVCEGMDSPVASVLETFSNVTDYTDFEADGWLNIMETGERKWQGKTYQDEKYIQASAHNASDGTHTMWALTPALDVDNAASKIVRFKTAMAYWNESTTFEVFAIQCNNGTSTETKLNPTLPNSSSTEHSWIESGDIDLSSYSGVVRIGFKYTGQGGSSNSTTWRIDDFEFNNTTTTVEFSSNPQTTVQSEADYLYEITTNVLNGSGNTTISATGIPAWATFTDNGDGTATIEGSAPSVSNDESSNILLTVTNNSVSAQQDYTLTVKAPVAPGSNLVVNGSFEDWTGDLPTGWDNPSYNQNMTKETSTVLDGNNSVKHTAGTSKMQQEVDIVGGKSYTISYHFLDNDVNARSRIWSYWLDDSNNTITDNASELRPSAYSADNANWQTVSHTLTAPSGAAKLRFEIRTYSTNDGGGVIYYDDFSVVEN